MSSFVDTSGEYDWMLKLSEYKYQLDMQSNLVDAKREAREEGRKEGREEGEKKIIELLKSGKSPEEIIEKYSAGGEPRPAASAAGSS